MKRTLQLYATVDLTTFVEGGTLVALNVGPDEQLYAVIAERPLDDRWTGPGGASFAKTVPGESQFYRVLAFFDGQATLDIEIADERFNIHDVQPLPDGEILLVCCRSERRGPTDFDKNGRVHASNGTLVRELLLGDGVASVQTTSSGLIWVSFFDEGVFGNYGWNTPVGASGLVAWDPQGNRVCDFGPGGGLDRIADCYALNVASASDTWLYYYSQFPLVRLRERRIDAHWQMPVHGSHAFAVSSASSLSLFAGGYDDANTYHLFALGPDGVRNVRELQLVDGDGAQIMAQRVIGRCDKLYILQDNRVYRLDVDHAAAA